MIDMLGVAHAAALRVNRGFYRELERRGWKVELAIPGTLPWRGSVEPREIDDPPLHKLSPHGSNTRFWSFEGLPTLVRQLRPKIIFLDNEPDSRMAWELGGIARELDARLVCVTNENDLPPPLGAFVRGEFRPALRSLRSRAWSLVARRKVDHVLAICDDGVAAMEALGFGGHVTKIPLGFDPALFFPYDAAARERTRRELGLTKTTVAYFGRLVEKKGVHLLIQALARLRDLEWQFLLDDVNEDDAYAARLVRMVKEFALEDRTVRFHALHAEMPAVMNAADIVAAPSIWKEQYGRVVPEAMACGRALVVSDIGAMPELLGDCGVKIPCGNVEALSVALRRLLQDETERMRIGRRAALRARDELGIGTQADIVERTLAEFL